MIVDLVNYYADGNQAKFAEKLGISAQNVSAWVKRKTFNAELIYEKCENVSAEWLLTGMGEMLAHGDQNEEKVSTQNVDTSDSKLLELCRLLVQNYQQRDEVMKSLVKMVSK